LSERARLARLFTAVVSKVEGEDATRERWRHSERGPGIGRGWRAPSALQVRTACASRRSCRCSVLVRSRHPRQPGRTWRGCEVRATARFQRERTVLRR